MLASLVAALETRKLVFLSRRPGPGAQRRPDPARSSAWRPTRSGCWRPARCRAGRRCCSGRSSSSLEIGAAAPERHGRQPAAAAARALHRQRRRHADPPRLAHRRRTRAGTASIARASRRCSSRRSSGRCAPTSSRSRWRASSSRRTTRGAAVVQETRGRALPDQVRRRAPGPGRRHRRRAVVAADARLPALLLAVAPGQPDHRLVRASSATASRASPSGTSSGAACRPRRSSPRSATRWRCPATSAERPGYFAFHSSAIAPPPPRTGSPAGRPTRAMLRSVPGRSPGLPYCMSGDVPTG